MTELNNHEVVSDGLERVVDAARFLGVSRSLIYKLIEGGELPSVKIGTRLLITAMNRQGTLFLWPIRLPGSDGRQDDWSKSSQQAADIATKGWVRVQANMPLGAYDIYEATGNFGDPGMALAYIDWSQQELAIAASLSGDAKMKDAYQSGDFYLTFAKMAGAVPADATKDNLDRLRFTSTPTMVTPEVNPMGRRATPYLKPKRMTGEFLKGPIPLPWLTVASKLRGKAPLAVALAIWFEAGRRKGNEVKLTTAILGRFNVKRKAKYTALKSLETAGLVRVRREPRRNPVVTILDVQSEPGAGGTSLGVSQPSPAPVGQRSLGDEQNGGT